MFSAKLLNWARKVSALLRKCLGAFTIQTPCYRSVALLREWLSSEQLAQFDRTRSFIVTGCDTGRRYSIQYGTATNIFEIDESGHTVVGWCFLPSGGLAAGDVMLAQKIALESDERAALQVARRFPVNCRRYQNPLGY
jgi:hypothetical protein